MIEHVLGIAGYAACGTQSAAAPMVRWPPPSPAGDGTPESPPVPLMLRRRVSPIGQAALRCAWLLPGLAESRIIVCSRHGEFDRTIAMLTQMADGEAPSPADFSLSVHNALAGLLSVATRNRNGHTALAAGLDSFGFGLMEAAACLHESPDQPVAVVYFDTRLPPDYPGGTPAETIEAQALALLLVPPQAAPRRVAMTAEPVANAEPQDAARVFLHFLETTAPAAHAAGEMMLWTWRHA